MNTQTAARLIKENPELVDSGRKQLDAVLKRSATDPTFRHNLLTDPHKTLEEFTGQPISATYNIKFVESHGVPTIVLPDPAGPVAELSETELEAVSGGSDIVVTLALFAASMYLGMQIAKATS